MRRRPWPPCGRCWRLGGRCCTRQAPRRPPSPAASASPWSMPERRPQRTIANELPTPPRQLGQVKGGRQARRAALSLAHAPRHAGHGGAGEASCAQTRAPNRLQHTGTRPRHPGQPRRRSHRPSLPAQTPLPPAAASSGMAITNFILTVGEQRGKGGGKGLGPAGRRLLPPPPPPPPFAPPC